MNKKWIRYRFYTKSVDDYRPLIFNEKFPWWCSGFNDENTVIIAWLPQDEDLAKYWDDAFDIESSEHDSIQFSSRFLKPPYYIESKPFNP